MRGRLRITSALNDAHVPLQGNVREALKVAEEREEEESERAEEERETAEEENRD